MNIADNGGVGAVSLHGAFRFSRALLKWEPGKDGCRHEISDTVATRSSSAADVVRTGARDQHHCANPAPERPSRTRRRRARLPCPNVAPGIRTMADRLQHETAGHRLAICRLSGPVRSDGGGHYVSGCCWSTPCHDSPDSAARKKALRADSRLESRVPPTRSCHAVRT